jgi:hypothetical protein
MDVKVASNANCGNNDGVSLSRTLMPQERYPHLTTSISGIGDDEWTAFDARAKQKGITKREALEEAIRNLVADMKDGRNINWIPSKIAKSRPVKIHADALDNARKIGSELDLRINVVMLTAMHRWVKKL